MSTSVHPAVHIAVPANGFAGDVPLVANMRGGEVSSIHRGIAVVAGVDGFESLELGDARQPVFLRSAAKPFQVMPAILSGAIDRFGITERELAVLCASHIAQPEHTEAVLEALRKAGLTEEALRCGVHPPMHQPTARERDRAGIEPTPVCNNCSGAHAGMLLTCQAVGWPIADYGDPDHPLQIWIRHIIADFAGMRIDSVRYAIDNCAVPTFQLPLRRSAQAFARLATGREVGAELGEAAGRVVRAMTRYPEMVGGEGRFDTELMRAAGGSVVAKGGAEGFQGVGLPGRGLGIAIKISDGSSGAAVVALRILRWLGALDETSLRALNDFEETEVRNHLGVTVGRLAPVFTIGERT